MPRLSLSLLMALVVTTAASTQKTLLVPQQYKTIQAAMAAAQASDVVLVDPGTYFENLVFPNRDITVRSSQGPRLTILDGSRQKASVVLFAAGNTRACRVEGFTITGGLGTWDPGNQVYWGGGVYCPPSSAPTLVNNIITLNGKPDLGRGRRHRMSQECLAGRPHPGKHDPRQPGHGRRRHPVERIEPGDDH